MNQKKKKPWAFCLHDSNAKGKHHFKINLSNINRKDCVPMFFLFTCRKEKKSYCLIRPWIIGFKKEFCGKGDYFTLSLDSKKDIFSYKRLYMELKNKYWRGAEVNRSLNDIKKQSIRVKGTNLYKVPQHAKDKNQGHRAQG